MDDGYMRNRHETGLRQVQSLLERMSTSLFRELAFSKESEQGGTMNVCMQ